MKKRHESLKLLFGALFALIAVSILTASVGLSSYKDALKPIVFAAQSAASANTTAWATAAAESSVAGKSITPQAVDAVPIGPGEPVVAQKTTVESSSARTIQLKLTNSGADSGSATTAIVHSALLKYGADVQANTENVEYSANFTVSSAGEACFQITVPQAESKCPFPYIRIRLTGAALVNVRIRPTTEGAGVSQLNGCALLPVSGTYFIDANLIHCRVNIHRRKVRPKKYKQMLGSPVWSDLNVPFQPHEFTVPPFIRRGATTLRSNQTNAYPNHAWVFAPGCKGAKHVVSEQCSQGISSPFLPTKIQMPEFLTLHEVKDFKSKSMHSRFDNYMWLPVNASTGAIDYKAEHFGYEYTPMPRFLEESKSGVQNQTIMFIGASHVRYLLNQVSQIYYNITDGFDGCQEEHTAPPDLGNNQTRFDRIYLRFVDQWMGRNANPLVSQYSDYDKYVVTIGHWDAGFPLDRPTPPGLFLNDILSILNILETSVKPSAEIFVTSVNQHPLGHKMLIGMDWRVSPLIDAYNDEILTQVEVVHPITSTRSFRFRDFNRSYFLDNSDIMDPVWDSATDFYHPCRYAMRPMALRVLDLLKE